MHLLFSYGTLQLEKVQLEIYGRKLKGWKDKLLGYKLKQLTITDEEVLRKSEIKKHPFAVKSNHKKDAVDGMIFEINENELIETDKYEVSEYKRVFETFESGKKAWVYVSNNPNQ